METQEMVTLFDGSAVTTTLVLAEGTANQHKNVIGMVRKYSDDLEEFGTLAFQTRKSGGLPTEFAYLNEPQATLLMTYMKNTPIIREFKKRLVGAFYELAASRQYAMQNTPQNPVQTKVSVNTTDLVKESNKGNRFAQRLLHHLTGMQVDDLAAEVEHRQIVEDFRRAELAAHYLDLLFERPEQPGINKTDSEQGLPCLQGETTAFFHAFEILAKLHGLPQLAKGPIPLGHILSKEASGLEFYGWARSLAYRTQGRRVFQFEKIGKEVRS